MLLAWVRDDRCDLNQLKTGVVNPSLFNFEISKAWSTVSMLSIWCGWVQLLKYFWHDFSISMDRGNWKPWSLKCLAEDVHSDNDILYHTYRVYMVYSVHVVYMVYMVYSVYVVYRVYMVYRVFRVYSVYMVYRVYIVYMVYMVYMVAKK